METKSLVGTTALMLALATGHARAEKQVPVWELNAHDQYEATHTLAIPGGAAIIDQYGDKLSFNGRWGWVDKCFDRYTYGDTGHMEKVLLWALCGEDLKAIKADDLKGDDNKRHLEEWKKVGGGIEAEAKDDPGVAMILKQAEAAKADWKAFEAKNHDAIVLYQKLKDGVRTSKSNDKNFDGCWEATQPAFAKAVKATKFSWDNTGDDAVDGRVAEIVTNPANYYAVANFGMCVYAAHATGAVLAGSALRARGAVFGWRTMLISQLLDPKFKPKFADRSLACCEGEARHIRQPIGSDVSFPWPGGSMKIQTGVISKMKKDGDDTTVNFAGTVVDGCQDWVETKKIRTWDTAGDPVYERICKKRGKVEQDAPDPATFATKLTDGFAIGVGVAFIGQFPEEAYDSKKKKFVAILGVAVKGSPAETPRIE